MEPKFIELHQRGGRKLLNVDKLVAVVDTSDNLYESAVLLLGSTTPRGFDESYDEIKQLIHDSGILIHRADPRLDETHPLTMEDLKEMIGEPVWNSNTGEWTLVRNYIEALEPDGIDVAFLLDAADNSAGITAGDLIKFPLYRMRRGDYECGRGSMSEEEAEVIRKEIVKNAELRMKLGAPPMEGL